MARVQYEEHVHDHDRWLTLPGYPLEPDFHEEEYRLRIDRARRIAPRRQQAVVDA